VKAQGDLTGAEVLFRCAAEGREKILGPDHPDTLRSLNNLADLLVDKGDCASAGLLYRRIAEARHRILGSDHPDTVAGERSIEAWKRRCPEGPV
jgi:hypothetical protein